MEECPTIMVNRHVHACHLHHGSMASSNLLRQFWCSCSSEHDRKTMISQVSVDIDFVPTWHSIAATEVQIRKHIRPKKFKV